MHLRHLLLTNFRNYASAELDLGPGVVLFLGENAQGKTNLLEAIALLATGRSERAATDADHIAWSVREDPQPFARVAGVAERGGHGVSVELAVIGRAGAHGNLVASKRLKLNGVGRRAVDVVGAITAVLFTTDDMELVKGSPSGRRRYLDVMLSQVDRAYSRALPRYMKVVAQRNALLKRIQDGAARRDELAYWDEELARDGATLLSARAGAVDALARAAAEAHAGLSGEQERFELAYAPRFVDGWLPPAIAAAGPAEIARVLLEKLQATQARDVAAGVTLSGPHRDDLSMAIGGEPAAAFASRGQQRTAALALRLAEARLLLDRTGERPLLLLDDVLSELDESRRASVLAAIDADQVLITSPDPDRFPASYTTSAQLWEIRAGTATRV
jgi:DNA replication and repair protein RecF